MATAVLLLGRAAPLLDRLTGQLSAAGLAVRTLPADPDGCRALAGIAGRADGPLVVLPADAVTTVESVTWALRDPRPQVLALTGDGPDAPFTGLLRVPGGQAAVLAAAATALADAGPGRDGGTGGSRPAGDPVGALAGSLRAELAGRTEVAARPLRGLAWARAADPEFAEAARAVADGLDVEAVRLAAAVKADDGFFVTHFVSPYSRYLARWAARRGITPNQVTVTSLLLGVLAALAFATGTRAGLVVGAVLVQASFTADCVDGQLARYTGLFSRFGGWLDGMSDRLKEFGIYAGLAVGAGRGFGEHVWPLAVATLVLQVARHAADFGYQPVRAAPPRGSRPGGARGRSWWLRKIAFLPIGERLALVSLTALAATPRVTFVVLLAAGLASAAYSCAGKLVRSGRAVAALRDDGPVAARLWRGPGRRLADGPQSWLLPPALRVLEYGVTGLLAGAAGGLPAGFGYLVVVAFFHYDTVYRWRDRIRPAPSALVAACGGWEGRTVLALVLAAFGVLPTGLVVLAVLLAVGRIPESLRAWLGPQPTGAAA